LKTVLVEGCSLFHVPKRKEMKERMTEKAKIRTEKELKRKREHFRER
jgi:hypothetical protein